MTRPRCLSLFSGCGGLDLGMKRAGFDLVFATDLDERCAESHQQNFEGVPFFQGSITEVDEALLRRFLGRKLRGAADLLVGGPPCPPFSKSRFYRKEKPRALKDPVGWETFGGYLRVLGIVRPKAFLLENVAGLAYGVHHEALDLLLREAGRLGYKCSWKVLNTADYGVPQIRERCIVIGMRSRSFVFPPPTHARPRASGSRTSGTRSASLPAWRTAGEVLAKLDTKKNASDERHFAGGQFHNLLCQIPPGDNYLYFTKERGHASPKFRWRSRYWSFLLKLSPDLPSWTIQARRSNNMGPFHWRNRILRIAEVKRLQTFPDTWALTGTVEQQWRQVGNAVPPDFAEYLARALRKQL
ncbi:MAG: DNA cytosine methyltransferase [Acidobacteria bacterium]|nr:DNA cytosine methyltransferase [Acidobacteriota bacterium]